MIFLYKLYAPEYNAELLIPPSSMAHSSFTTEQDFSAAFDRYSDALFRHSYLRTRSRDTAKELVMEAFVRLWDFIAAGNFVDSTQMFLYREMHRGIEREKAKGMVPVEHADLQDQPGMAKYVKLLEKLSPDAEPATILHYVDGFTLKDIGTILGGSIRQHADALGQATALLSA